MGRCEKNLPLTTGIAFSSFESGCAQGMATRDHTPHGRGYDTSFGYFHHANNCERHLCLPSLTQPPSESTSPTNSISGSLSL